MNQAAILTWAGGTVEPAPVPEGGSKQMGDVFDNAREMRNGNGQKRKHNGRRHNDHVQE
jgi:hypothetical protein